MKSILKTLLVLIFNSRKNFFLRKHRNSTPLLFHLRTLLTVEQLVHCRKFDAIRKCVDLSLKGCDDPTPSDIINSMLMAVRKATPCQQASSMWFTATSGTAPAHSYATFSGLVSICVLRLKLWTTQ